MGTFSRIFGVGKKELQEKADEIILDLSKGLQSASAKLCVASKSWGYGDIETLLEIEKEIIEIERECDEMRDRLIENIFSQRAYLPQQTQERHRLINYMDDIVDAAEEAIRIMSICKDINPRSEIRDIAEKCWKSTDLLQDAIKYLFKDFDRSVDFSHKVSEVREEARDIQFQFLGCLLEDTERNPTELQYLRLVARTIVEVAIDAEKCADFIRALAVKYS
ncbi:MAG: DUF47 family protein [Candidatus Thorarchaeota archaeon]